jgi:hypothetical protein
VGKICTGMFVCYSVQMGEARLTAAEDSWTMPPVTSFSTMSKEGE